MIEKFFAAAFVFVSAVISAGGYAGIVFLMAIESACIPLPSELIMPFAGYLATKGQFTLLLAGVAGAVGCNLGSIPPYEIGRRGGRALVERYGQYIWLNQRDLELADKLFQKYGEITIFVGRLLPVVRTFIALPAGIGQMPRVRFHVYTFIGSLIWCYALAWLGAWIGEHWQETMHPYFIRFKEVVVVILALGVIWFVWSHWKHRVRTA